MKKIKIITLGIMLLFLGNTTQAQVAVNLTFGSPPLWGPVGYTDVRYYYLPDVEAYYNVQNEMFIYNQDGYWVERYYLPTAYRNYDLYNGYKVVLADYHGFRPYDRFTYHQHQYKRGYRHDYQRTIGHRPDHGYQQYDYQYSRRTHHKHRDGYRGIDAVQYNQRQQPAHRDARTNEQQHKQQPQRSVRSMDQQRQQQPQRSVKTNNQQHKQQPQRSVKSNDQQRQQQPQRNMKTNSREKSSNGNQRNGGRK